MQVHLHEQKMLEDKGRTVIVPVTRLDNAAKVLGSFFDTFEGRYYWWQCWEMTRRLLQVMVGALQLVVGESLAVLYGVIIAFIAILLQQQHTPYTDDRLDRLQMLLLLTQFILQLSIMHFLHARDEDDVLIATTCFFGVQLFIMAYVTAILAPMIANLWGILKRHSRRKSSVLARRVTHHSMALQKKARQSLKGLIRILDKEQDMDEEEAEEEQKKVKTKRRSSLRQETKIFKNPHNVDICV